MRPLPRSLAPLVLAVSVGAGATCDGSPRPAESPGPDAETAPPLSAAERSILEEEVREADRAFARSTAEGGIDGWLAHMADDAVRVDLRGETARGHDEIRRMDGPLFEDPDLAFEWEPSEAGLFSGGTTAFTRGRYRLVDLGSEGTDGAVLARGTYLTVWRREPDGWKVILDTGAPDPAG